MQKFDGYEDIVIDRPRKIRAGLYKGKIVGTKIDKISTKNGDREILRIYFDIAEGEYKDYFKINYELDSSDPKKKRWNCELDFFLQSESDTQEQNKRSAEKFKRFIKRVEESNKDYTFGWDEKTLKNKAIGLAFRLEEFTGREGNIACATKLGYVVSIEQVDATFDPNDRATYPKVKCIDNTLVPYADYIEKLKKVQDKVQEEASYITIEDTDDIPF